MTFGGNSLDDVKRSGSPDSAPDSSFDIRRYEVRGMSRRQGRRGTSRKEGEREEGKGSGEGGVCVAQTWLNIYSKTF
jgi:hypothetical protein